MDTLILLKTVGALFFVVGLLFFSLYLLRKFGRFTPTRLKQKDSPVLVGQTYVGPKKNISVFKFHGKLLVVGVCDSAMTLLTEIDIDEKESADFKEILDEKNVSSAFL